MLPIGHCPVLWVHHIDPRRCSDIRSRSPTDEIGPSAFSLMRLEPRSSLPTNRSKVSTSESMRGKSPDKQSPTATSISFQGGRATLPSQGGCTRRDPWEGVVLWLLWPLRSTP